MKFIAIKTEDGQIKENWLSIAVCSMLVGGASIITW